uniref:Uncharacterized protein n=1 Tax=Physcomitrium patens TaxID=3218 RepID=A0A7I3ZCU6_PHYPA
MLTVSNDEFWEDVTPVNFGSLPRLQDGVTVVGYPIGGDTILLTSGVVSRIEVTSYVHGATELLGVQVRSAVLQACAQFGNYVVSSMNVRHVHLSMRVWPGPNNSGVTLPEVRTARWSRVSIKYGCEVKKGSLRS